jgi:hypothetical protein
MFDTRRAIDGLFSHRGRLYLAEGWSADTGKEGSRAFLLIEKIEQMRIDAFGR